MTKEEARDDMLIDNPNPQNMDLDSFPDDFNPNYLKLYYGTFSSLIHYYVHKWVFG